MISHALHNPKKKTRTLVSQISHQSLAFSDRCLKADTWVISVLKVTLTYPLQCTGMSFSSDQIIHFHLYLKMNIFYVGLDLGTTLHD